MKINQWDFAKRVISQLKIVDDVFNVWDHVCRQYRSECWACYNPCREGNRTAVEGSRLPGICSLPNHCFIWSINDPWSCTLVQYGNFYSHKKHIHISETKLNNKMQHTMCWYVCKNKRHGTAPCWCNHLRDIHSLWTHSILKKSDKDKSCYLKGRKLSLI